MYNALHVPGWAGVDNRSAGAGRKLLRRNACDVCVAGLPALAGPPGLSGSMPLGSVPRHSHVALYSACIFGCAKVGQVKEPFSSSHVLQVGNFVPSPQPLDLGHACIASFQPDHAITDEILSCFPNQ